MSGLDINFLSFADESGLRLRRFTVEPANSDALGVVYADSLKISHCADCQFSDGTIYGSRENAVDLNRESQGILLEDLTLIGGRQSAIVVKGGCRSVTFRHVLIIADKKSWCDVLWDDWSDQSREPSSGVLENVHRDDGRPVRVVFGRFHRPTIKGGNVRILWAHSFALHLYNIGKGLLRTLKLA